MPGLAARARTMLDRPRERPLASALGHVAASVVLTHRRRTMCSSGLGVRIHTDLRTPLGLSLYRYGWTDPLAHHLPRLVDPGDHVVDGGANVGLMTLPLARAVGPGGSVTAFEPATGTRELLEANIALNGFENVLVRPEALIDVPGPVQFGELEPGAGTASIAYGDEPGGEAVPGTTLDEALGARPVTLLKLDLEGAELKALRGATGVLAHQRPIVVMELEPEHLASAGGTLGELEVLADAAGYDAAALGLLDGALREVPLGPGWQRPPGATENVILRPR